MTASLSWSLAVGLAAVASLQDPTPAAPGAAAAPGTASAPGTSSTRGEVAAPRGGDRTEPVSLHGVWMIELLDLDFAAAVDGYRRIATSDDQPLLDRQIATARLTELRRIGVGRQLPPPSLDVLPRVLRQHCERVLEAETSPVLQQEILAGAGDDQLVREFFASTEAPQLRPLVDPIIQAGLEQADPELPRGRRLSRVLDRIYAKDVLRAELDGRRTEAEELRRTHFGYWSPQAWPADHERSWQQVQTNLRQWSLERQLLPDERALLRRLQETLQAAAADGPQRALEFLDRLPLYEEQLREGIRTR